MIRYWRLHNLRMLYNPIIKGFLTRSLVFLRPLLFGILDRNILPAMIALRFDLEGPARQMVVFFLTSKTSVNRWSGFLVLGFLEVT